MKKLILTYLLIFPVLISVAQQKTNNAVANISIATIGNTTFDLQSYGSVRRLTYLYPNGTMGAIWNYSTDLTGTYPDLYSAYQYFDGTSWGPGPFQDTLPPFANIDRLSNGTEIVLGYDTSSASGLRIDTANVPGSNTWAGMLLPPEPNGHQCGWPHIAVGGVNGMSVHVISLTEPVAFGGFLYSGVDGMLTYSRSEDGGATWNIVHATLPGWNSSVTARMYPDEYNIDAKGNIVAITAGGRTNDWVLWKSTDNGTTFTKTTIETFPLPAYNEFTMTIDTNSDGVADTLDVPDGSMSVLVDNNGMVHCWSGSVGIYDDTVSSAAKLNYLYGYGILYWNQSMGSTVNTIGSPFVSNPPAVTNVVYYGGGICTMPASGIDGNGNIYLCYSANVEGTDDGSGNTYKHIYAIASSNNGQYWSNPLDLFNDLFTEEVFPSIARNVDSKIRIVYQQDGTPGSSVLNQQALGVSDIDYLEADTADVISGIQASSKIRETIKVFPNPFSESTQLIFDNEHHDLISINLLDVSGRVIITFNTSGSKYLLNTSGIEKGIYVLRVSNPANQEVQIAKLVKD